MVVELPVPGTDAKSTAAPQEPTYQVGDTVYLEDTAYIVEEIGLFDVQLRDPTLAYPVLRAESKERLGRMLWADVRNNPASVPGTGSSITLSALGRCERSAVSASSRRHRPRCFLCLS